MDNQLIATSNERTGKLDVKSDITNATMAFDRIICAIAYGDPSQSDPLFHDHAAIVAGQQVDGRYNILAETIQEHDADLVSDLIYLKDNFLITFIYGPECPRTAALRLVEGLSQYAPIGRDTANRVLWLTQDPKGTWSTFRGRDVKAIIQYYPQEHIADFSMWFSTVSSYAEKGILLTDAIWTPRLLGSISKNRDIVSTMPIFRAYVYAVAMLDWWKATNQPKRKSTRRPWPDSWGT